MEDFEEAGPRGPLDHPVVATLAGAAVLVIGALLVPRFVPQQPLGTLLAIGAVAALALWAVGFAVAMQPSPVAWKLGSLVLLVVAGLGVAMVAHGQYETIARADASSFAEVEFGPGGAALVPAGAASRGPLSRMFVANVTADLQAQRDYDAAFGGLGVGNLNSPYLLERDPRMLANCGGLNTVKALAETQAAAHAQRVAAMARSLDSANLPAKAKEGIGTMAGVGDKADPLLANRVAMLDATNDLCGLLARRGWFNNGGYFGFRTAGDEARFRALSARRLQLAGDAATIEHAAHERMAAGRDQVRDVLSRSIFSGG